MSSDQPKNRRARSYRALGIIALVLAVALFLAYRQGLWRSVGAGPTVPPASPPAAGEEPPPAQPPSDAPPRISRLAVSYDRPDGNWRVVFRRLTAWAEAPGADEVVFMMAPTGSDETGREVGRATRQSPGQTRFSAVVDLGSGASTFHLWAVARGPGGEARSDILDLIYDGERPEPDKIEGVPLYPGFHWHMGSLTEGQRTDLAAAFGQDFDRGATQLAFTDWLWDANPDAIRDWLAKAARDQGRQLEEEDTGQGLWALRWHEGSTVVTIRLAAEAATGAAGGGSSQRYRMLLSW
ncbi:MAG: hypothetical protein ACM3ZA_12760 [Bacillota bacterium]